MRSILVAALALGAGWIGQQDRGAGRSLEFRFIGNEAVAMSDGRQTIVTDFPYQSGYSGYMTFEASAAPYLVRWGGRTAYFVGDTEDPDALVRQRGLDVAFVTPWLLRTVEKQKLKIDARSIVIYHHQAGESVPRCERCTTPEQNSVFRLSFLEGGP